MHELSIVMSIIQLADEQVRLAGANSVECIELEIGQLAGIEMPALELAWEVAVKNTVLERAQRVISAVKGRARCLECHHEFDCHELYSKCPQCESYFSEIIQGKELKVRSLTVDDTINTSPKYSRICAPHADATNRRKP